MTDDTMSSPPDTLGRRLPLILRALQNHGVTSMIAAYNGALLGVIFLGKKGEMILPPNCSSLSLQIVRVLHPILKSRYPNVATDHTLSGTFFWDLKEDTLEHQHVTVHEGL